MDNRGELLNRCNNITRPFYPLSQSQLGIYYACLPSPGTDMYSLQYSYRFAKEQIDVDRMIEAVKNALAPHDILRCHISLKDGEPFMVPGDEEIDVPHIRTTEAALQDELERMQRSVGLENDTLFLAEVLETETEYCLAFAAHHIIIDGTSIGVLAREISTLYAGGTIDVTSISAMKLGVFDQELEHTPQYEEAREFYEKRYEGNDVRTEILPDVYFDRGESGSRLVEIYSDNIVPEVVEFTGGRNVGLFFTAAFAYALAKFTGNPEAYFCTANHGRFDPSLAGTIGMLVRTLPVCTRIDEEMTVRDYLETAKTELKEIIRRGYYPFTKLASKYGLSMDVVFVYHGSSFNHLDLGSTRSDFSLLMSRDPLADVNTCVYEDDGRYKMQILYRSDLYTEDLIRSFAAMYFKIITEFTKKEYLREIDLMDERELLLQNRFNDTSAPFDTSKTVVELFREQVSAHPENTAVVFRNRSYTYKETDELSENAAAFIHSLGIGREDVVSILIPRNEYMVLASLAVLKAGAAYQPLDPTYPAERLEFMMKDAGAKLLIADETLLSLVPNYTGKVLLTKDIPSLPSQGALPESPKSEDLFILLYTSGSTGTPKGVMLEHGNIAAFCQWYRKTSQMTETSRTAAYASYGFDACMLDLYPTLTSGAAVHILPEETRLDLNAINHYFNDHQITHSFMTTQVGRTYASDLEDRHLQFFTTGGETLVPFDPPKRYDFRNLYGPTECTVCITSFPVDRLYDKIPIGRPLDNVKLYVCDRYGRRLPAGACGELCVTGCQVGRGYLNRPELTAFSGNPFSSESGYERLYHTGDIVRWLPDGNIDFIGRRDGQVKIRGFRIELSEVEGVIRAYAGIRDAAVIAVDAPGGGKQIAAYIVSDEKVNIPQLRQFIKQQKPDYMVPSVIMQIDSIPLNVNGKVNKKALPPAIADEQKETTSGPRVLTDIEEQLSKILKTLLDTDRFEVDVPLQSYGLTSLSVIRLAVKIRDTFGVELEVRKLLRNCTIISLENEIVALLISRRDAKKETVDQTEDTSKPYPLSASQFGVYSECMLSPDTTMYNIPLRLLFDADSPAEEICKAFRTVVQAHPTLFTRLSLMGEDVVQHIRSDAAYEVPLIQGTEAEADEYLAAFTQPFTLIGGPLFRAAVVKTETYVALTADFHHIIADGSSVDLMTEQLLNVLNGVAIIPEIYSYRDYVQAEEVKQSGGHYARAEAFFAELLKKCEAATEIPADRKGRPEDGAAKEYFLPVDDQAISDRAQKLGITPAAFYLGAALYTCARFTGMRAAYLNTISNGRSDLRLSESVGMFVKTIPVAADFTPADMPETVSHYLKKTAELYLGAIENEAVRYEEICRKFNYSPAVMFTYQLGLMETRTWRGKEVRLSLLPETKPKFKLTINIDEQSGVPGIHLVYNDALYSDSYMKTFADALATVLSNMAASPDADILKVSMVSAKERELLNRFEAVEQAEVPIQLLHEMFRAQAAKTPDRIAVLASDGSVTYRELDRLSNIAANVLIQKGVRRGDRVAVYIRRSYKLFYAIFGILKAGATFIPIASDYPKDRIDYIIGDSEARFIITEEHKCSAFANALSINALTNGSDEQCPEIDMDPMDLAYMLYTSGSTGTPKGVMLPHQGICNYFTNADSNVLVKAVSGKGHVYGSVTTVTFDIGMHEHMMSLCHGLTLAFADDEMVNDVIKLTDFLEENHVDVFSGTQSRILQYMDYDRFADCMARCSVIIAGGEPYPVKLLELLKERTNAELYNFYAPTEVTVAAFAVDLRDHDVITVGPPMLNRYASIVDVDNNRVPTGVEGELIISGIGVGRGYNNLPERTTAAFITWEDKRAFRTGDFARWTQDGEVVLLGRKDNQVKLRGLRIELDEIISRLAAIEGVQNATAFIRKINGNDALVAYFTASCPLEPEYVRSELKKHLTEFMIPSSINQVERMPLTPNGKIDLRALPEPAILARLAGREPKNHLERTFCRIFSEILGVDNVFATDSFFDLGGSSLLVTRVILAAQKEDLPVSYADVFANPTPEKLAVLMSGNTCQDDPFDMSQYDYTAINKLLANNDLDSFRKGEKMPLGSVLLLGSTGFAGIHVLHELLTNYDTQVYCLVRGRKQLSPEKRLDGLYYYYFLNTLEEYTGRLTVLPGDLTDRSSLEQLKDAGINTVINCAANVKHFSNGTDIEDINYYGVLNLIDFCRTTGAQLVQTSTISVSGYTSDENAPAKVLDEKHLFIGQTMASNKYIASKFMAERAVLEASAKGEITGKVIRLGNLAPRRKDGKFQINFESNAFMNRVRTIHFIGKYPYEALEQEFDMSPIDCVADAIVRFAQAPKEICLLYGNNNHSMIMGDLFYMMGRSGLNAECVELQAYSEAFKLAQRDPSKTRAFTGMLAYENTRANAALAEVATDNRYSAQVLMRMGFKWPVISEEYMQKFLIGLIGLGYFD